MAKKARQKKTDKAVVKFDDAAYPKLLEKCKETISKVEKSILSGYWELGKHVNDLRGKDRAKYGEKTIQNLADDLDMSRSQLYYASQFNRICSEDELSNALDKGLGWRHVVQLLGVQDEEKRLMLAEKASQDNLTSEQLKAEAEKLKKKSGKKGGGRKKEYNFGVFYNRMTKISGWLDDGFVKAFEIGETKIKKKEIKELEDLHERIGTLLQRIQSQ